MGARTTLCGESCAGRLATWLALAFGVLGSLAAASPSPVFAGTYTVNVCTPPPEGGNAGNLLRLADPGTVGLIVTDTCNTSPAQIRQTARGPSVTGGTRWQLRAPEGTRIQTLTAIRGQIVTWESPDLVWEIRNDRDRLERISGTAPGGPLTYAVDSNLVFAHLACAGNVCVPPDGSFDTSVALENLVATLKDEVVPEVSIDPAQPLPATVRGTIGIPFIASDVGSGLVGGRLFVDGEFVAFVVDGNDGDCALPFRDFDPCKLNLRSSIPLDTSALADGRHEVKVEVEDAGGARAESETLSIEVHNAPAPIGPTVSPPQIDDRTAPVLSRASLSRKSFRVGKARTALIAAAGAAPGTVLRFSSSEAGKLSIAIVKAKKGAKPIATLTRSIAAGRGKVPLSGRIGSKPLRPGRYRLTLSARDAAGNASAPVALPFTILPPAD
jgi:hypothetical protein